LNTTVSTSRAKLASRAAIRAAAALAISLALAGAAPRRALAQDEQRGFASAEEATAALVEAAKAKDHAAIHAIFGPDASALVSGDPVEDASDFDAFASACAEAVTVSADAAGRATVSIGRDAWPFPIPLVRGADGRWRFDTAAGKEEILNRRVGENELSTIRVCRAYVRAQREYASEDRDGDDVLEYAQRLASTPGKRDGLYWPAGPGEPASPFGPLVAQARAEGYPAGEGKGPRPYHGYRFHILTRQGAGAPGGAYDYVINGHMIAGFALVAYPAIYGQSGVMTFIVSQTGKVFEKDLGEKTVEAAEAMKEYDPDAGWTRARE
jgi:hypothetical protein